MTYGIQKSGRVGRDAITRTDCRMHLIFLACKINIVETSRDIGDELML